MQSYGEKCHWKYSDPCNKQHLCDALPPHIRLPLAGANGSKRNEFYDFRCDISHEFEKAFSLTDGLQHTGLEQLQPGFALVEDIHRIYEAYFGVLLPIVSHLAAIELMRSWAYDHKMEPNIEFLRPNRKSSPLTESVSFTLSEQQVVPSGKEFDQENQPGLQWFQGSGGPSNPTGEEW
jgi:hypothetical protein